MRSAEARLTDMLIAAADAAEIVERGRDQFMRDRLLQRAAKNVVSEIGEAAKGIPDEILEQISGVPWSAVKGIREKVVHDYPQVDLVILWDTLALGIPELAARVKKFRDDAAS